MFKINKSSKVARPKRDTVCAYEMPSIKGERTCCGTFCKIKSSLIWKQMKTIARRDVHISGSHFGCITVNLWKRRACYGSKLFRKIFTFVICKIWFVFRKLTRNFADFSYVIRRNFAKGKNCVNYCVLPKSKILLKLFLRG